LQLQDFARPSNGGFWGSDAKYYQHVTFTRPNVNANWVDLLSQKLKRKNKRKRKTH